MSKARASVSPVSGSIGQSPLVRTLSDWNRRTTRTPKMVFSSRLADLIDISKAIELSDAFKLLKRVKREGEVSDTDIVGDYWRQRGEIEAAIDACFEPQAETDPDSEATLASNSFRLPEPSDELLTDPDGFKPWLRFYGLQQSEMERRVAVMRSGLMSRLRASTDALAQVAAIESAIEPIVVSYSRRCLSVIPNALSRRFDHHRQSQRALDEERQTASSVDDWLSEGGWLKRFHQDTRQLLRAELSLRMQPIEGLVEALGYEVTAPDSHQISYQDFQQGAQQNSQQDTSQAL